MLQAGLIHFSRNCAVCHGTLGISSGVLPDLRWSTYTADADAWNNVVIGGALSENGMVSFEDVITPEDAEAIRAYVVTQAHLNRASDEPPAPSDEPIGPGMDEVEPGQEAQPEMETPDPAQ